MTEEWRDVPGWEGWYQLSSLGRHRKIRASRKGPWKAVHGPFPVMLTPVQWKKGYWKIYLGSCDGTRRPTRVFLHRAIWQTFRGAVPEGMTINHVDGDKRNNAIANLELATHQEQCDHAIRIGTRPDRKISLRDVKAMRKTYHSTAATQADLAERYGISQSMVSQIVTRRYWSRLNDRWFE